MCTPGEKRDPCIIVGKSDFASGDEFFLNPFPNDTGVFSVCPDLSNFLEYFFLNFMEYVFIATNIYSQFKLSLVS